MAQFSSAAWGSEPGASRWGHWAPQILILTVAATVALALKPLPPTSPMAPLTPVLLIALVLATWLQLRRHDRALCEHCVAAMPLNPSESAERYRRRLALAHLGSHPRAVVGYLAALLAAGVALAVSPPALMPTAVMVWVAVQASLVYLMLSHVTHRRLQPWCARCSDGGGPEDVGSFDPVPFDSTTR